MSEAKFWPGNDQVLENDRKMFRGLNYGWAVIGTLVGHGANTRSIRFSRDTLSLEKPRVYVPN